MAGKIFKRLTGTVAISVALVALTGCSGPDDDAQNEAQPTPSVDNSHLDGNSSQSDENVTSTVYSGRLPCDDCDAIDATLTLRTTRDNQPSGYTLSEKHLKDGKTTNVESSVGQWTKTSGTADDQNAVVYQIGSQDNPHQLYLELKGKTLRLLDDSLALYKKEGDQHSYELNAK
ncbi:copper resistance protein NlpE N-terminal domain-containing protein [Carnimonas bestiolae]|uniref:copper resistance protein NlpE N-terminal domain-containing protein n=1 Tax=Carnimonas bestiolae TaxID=3402172 RepID=UPI003EDB82EA